MASNSYDDNGAGPSMGQNQYVDVTPHDRDMMIRTIIGEAASEPDIGQQAVANVIMNRTISGKYGSSPTSVVTAPHQFTTWSDRPHELMAISQDSPQYRRTANIVDGVLSGALQDKTNGSVNYLNPTVTMQQNGRLPAWAQGSATQIGRHVFLDPSTQTGRSASPPRAPLQSQQDLFSQPQAGSSSTSSVSDDNLLKALSSGGEASAPASSGQAPGIEFQQPQQAAASSPSSPASSSGGLPALTVTRGPATNNAQISDDQILAGLASPAAAAGAPTASSNAAAVPAAQTPSMAPGGAPGESMADANAAPINANNIIRAAGTGIPIVGGLLNKADAALNAAIAPIANPLFAKGDQLQGQSFGERYKNSLAQQNAMDTNFAAQHPTANTAANITGAIGAAVPAMAAAPAAFGMEGGLLGSGLAGRMGLAAGTGGAIGGTDAAIRGNDPLVGAGVGAAGGAAGPVLGGIAGTVGNKFTNFFTPNASGAGRAATNIMTKGMQEAGPEGVTNALANLGPNASLVDTSPTFRGMATGAASNTSGKLPQMLANRSANANAMIRQDIDSTLGSAIDPIRYSNALRIEKALNDSTNYGKVTAQNVTVDPAGILSTIDKGLTNASGNQRQALTSLRNEITKNNSSEYLHNVRQDLDGMINYGKAGLGMDAGAVQGMQGALKSARGAIDDALKTQVPGMREADAAAAQSARQISAVKDGANVLGAGKSAVSPENFATQWAKMAPAEQDAMRIGARGEVDRLLAGKQNDVAALNTALQSGDGWNAAKLSIMFGPDAVNQLSNSIARASTFGLAERGILGATNAAQQNSGADLLRPNPLLSEMPDSIGSLAKGLLKGGVGAFKTDPAMVNARVADALARQGPEAQRLAGQLAGRGTIVNTGQEAARAFGMAGANPLVKAQYQKRRPPSNALLSGSY